MYYLSHIALQILLAKLLLFLQITAKLFGFNVISIAKCYIYAKKLPPLLKTSCYHVYTDVPFRDVVGWENVPETFSDDQPFLSVVTAHIIYIINSFLLILHTPRPSAGGRRRGRFQRRSLSGTT